MSNKIKTIKTVIGLLTFVTFGISLIKEFKGVAAERKSGKYGD